RAVGYLTSIVSAAQRTLSTSRSNGNSGVWTPTTTSPSAYFSDHARQYASVRSQLMHVYVQKSTSTTFPRRASLVSGGELSQPVAPSNPGRWPSMASRAILSTSVRAWNLTWLCSADGGAAADTRDARWSDPRLRSLG